MIDKLLLKGYRPPVKPAARAAAKGRQVIRLGRHWALAVNWKIVSAFGLAFLVWTLIIAVFVTL